MFSEIFSKRFVNNIYFDSIDLKNYHDNVDGSTYRKKVRIRWYGDLFGTIEKPVLEIKTKNGLLGKKESFALAQFKLDEAFSFDNIKDDIDKADIPEIVSLELRSLEPVVVNRYCRKYFMCANTDYRITVDSGLLFYAVSSKNNSFLHRALNDEIILEVKYDEDKDDIVTNITSHFPFRLSKSSKYVTGINKLYNY